MVKRIFRKIVAVNIIASLFLSTLLSYSPLLPIAEAATMIPVEHRNSNILSFIRSIKQNTVPVQEEQNESNSVDTIQDSNLQTSSLNDNNDQTTLSQEEIDKIVNEHTLANGKSIQTPKQGVDEEPLGM